MIIQLEYVAKEPLIHYIELYSVPDGQTITEIHDEFLANLDADDEYCKTNSLERMRIFSKWLCDIKGCSKLNIKKTFTFYKD